MRHELTKCRLVWAMLFRHAQMNPDGYFRGLHVGFADGAK